MMRCMGIHVELAVFADRISDDVWQAIYEKARRVATQWTPRPLGTAWRHIGVVRVAQYTLEIETSDGLHLAGDAESLTTADSFVFPARLDRRELPRGSRGSRFAAQAISQGDVLSAVARRLDGTPVHPAGLCNLLGPKTQGLPYHVLLVALGLLVENALPNTAVVYGELSPRDGEQARRGLASILGEEFELPVVMDVERMRRRLVGTMEAGALDEALHRLGPPDPYQEAMFGDLLARLRSRPDARVRRELEHVVPTCRDPNHLQPGTQQLLRAILDMARSAVIRGELRPRIEQWGAAKTREVLACMTQDRDVRLTSMAWDAIEAADLDELAFLIGVLCVGPRDLGIHHAVRAVLENPALRRL
jgi:hypothetical protein